MLIPDDQPKGSMYTPEAHVLLAKDLTHPVQSPPNLQMDLKFAPEASIADVHATRMQRMKKSPEISTVGRKS